MEIKIPKSVKVGGKTYKVVFPYTFTERTDLRAQCCDELQEIRVSYEDRNNARYPDEQVAESFLHELIHAIDEIYNSHALTEEETERLSNGIYQVIKDNKFIKTE